MKVPVSILIPTRNEAANLPRCLQSVAWAEEVFVVDSASNDGTIDIGLAYGARVVQFDFSGTWPKKKNWALDHLPFRHEWVLILDADEVMPPEAEEEIRGIVLRPGDHAGYWINRRLMFMGRWLQHSYYPNWNLRLFQHARGRYEKLTESDTASGDNEVHEHVIVNGSTGFLHSEMDHYAFPSVAVFVEKHNRYSNWEARVEVEGICSDDATLQSPRVRWRRRLKTMARHLPCRSVLRFLYIYVLQRGFLDGREGFFFARLHGIYESLTQAKVYELRQSLAVASQSLPVRRETAPQVDVAPLNVPLSSLVSSGERAALNGLVHGPIGSGPEKQDRPQPAEESAGPIQRICTWLFCAFLVVVFFFTLRPSVHGERVKGLPSALGKWINGHDAWSNYLAFTLLALLWLGSRLPESIEALPQARPLLRYLSTLRGRTAVFCALMVAIELIQFCIPGRVYDLRDIAMGWLAALTAVVLWKAIKRSGLSDPVPLPSLPHPQPALNPSQGPVAK